MVRHNTQASVTPSKVLAGMLIVSVVCMLIPRRYDRSDQVKEAASPPFSMLAALMNRVADQASPAARQAVQSEGGSSLSRQMLEGQLLAMAEEVRNLRQRNSELSTLRQGGYIPRRFGHLIAADVISRDSLAYRSVLEIDHGRRGGAVKGQYAATAVYLDRGSQDGLKASRNVFTVESLAGQIVWVGPYTSRVQLLTDPASQVPVRIARLVPNSPAGLGYAPGTYVLEGAGQGMVIREQVDARLVETRQIQVGDLVILEPNPNLPEEAASLRRAGRISNIRPGSTQSVRTLEVAPLLNLDALRHVYVFDPTPVEK